ncbi:hypothetical protein [Mesonia aquimarina]|uniref:hypothetical protein n=1 Tax=Mesonia aquimarina TaxID=1504967 RepID=UPI000EF62539|nr:hypothetical protein [Mesonia aquimarina]
MLVNIQQKEIPKPDETEPGKEYGVYSFEEFFFENWAYITIVVILAVIVLLYGRYKKKERREDFEKLKKEQEKS